MEKAREELIVEAIEKVVDVASKITHAEWSRISQNVEMMFHIKATKRKLDSLDVERLRDNLTHEFL